MFNDQAEILNLDLFQLALLQFEIELVTAEALQDKVHDLVVLLQHFSVDEDVVEVYAHYTFGDEVPEDIIHHCLESGWAFDESEEHNKGFKQFPVGLESGLPLVSLMDVHVVIASLNV
ncbi:hypothetical protein C0989_007227 [Termitomyces sp. Mn162]|nr:hypothetical protein C0989_007227 [Termitomyces sp. Mn162]